MAALLHDQLSLGSAAAVAMAAESSSAAHSSTQADLASNSNSVPSFALYLDATLTSEGFKSLCKDPDYLCRDVPLCGKCVGHVWMDSFLLRERFGLEVNPVSHPLHQQRSVGAADGSGSGGGAAASAGPARREAADG